MNSQTFSHTKAAFEETLDMYDPFCVKVEKDCVRLQQWGFEIVLCPDGTYYINDTAD